MKRQLPGTPGPDTVLQGIPTLTQAREVARKLMKDGPFSVDELAWSVSVTGEELSAWLDGRGEHEALARRVVQLASEQIAGADHAARDEAVVETPSIHRIWSAFDLCAIDRTLGVVVSPPGCGKTLAATSYAKARAKSLRDDSLVDHPQARPASGRVFYAAMTASSYTISAALQRLAEEISWSAALSAYRSYEIFDGLVKALSPGDLIIVDEAQRLDGRAFESMRDLYDVAGVGIVFLGNPATWRRIAGRPEFAQIRSRVGVRIELEGPTVEDVAAILLAWGVRGRAERTLAHQIVGATGGLRELGRVLSRAQRFAAAAKRPVDVLSMHEALSSIGTIEV